MSNLPANLSEGAQPSRQLVRAARARESTELAIYEHHLGALYDQECSRIDSQVIAEVARFSLENGLDVLDWGLERAGSSLVKRELVARAVSRQAELDNAQIMRRFGGR
jgi:hypothetical protein